jgi:hypothetical protein
MFLDEYLCKYLKRRADGWGIRLFLRKRRTGRQRQAQDAGEAVFFWVMSRKTKMAPGEAGYPLVSYQC